MNYYFILREENIMAKDPAFLFYSNDFLSGTYLMNDEQVGKYIRLLCLQHQKGSLSKKDMLNICKTYDEDIFSKFSIDKDDNYFNIRLKDEFEKRRAYSESRSINRKGKKSKKTSKTYDNHMEDEDGNKDVIIDKYNKMDFDKFWNLYDKKVGKKEKIKSKWDKLTKEIQQKILDYLPKYIKSQPDKKFRKHPETFFNNESWNDEIINETSGIDKVELKEYYTKEYRGADDKTIKESYGKFCKCIFDETKTWGDKPFFLAKIDKPLSYREFKIIHNTLKFSDSTYADWEFIMNQITEFPQYYKNKKSVNEIFKNAIWGKLKIKVK